MVRSIRNLGTQEVSRVMRAHPHDGQESTVLGKHNTLGTLKWVPARHKGRITDSRMVFRLDICTRLAEAGNLGAKRRVQGFERELLEVYSVHETFTVQECFTLSETCQSSATIDGYGVMHSRCVHGQRHGGHSTFQCPSGALPKPAQSSAAFPAAHPAQFLPVSSFFGGVTKW